VTTKVFADHLLFRKQFLKEKKAAVLMTRRIYKVSELTKSCGIRVEEVTSAALHSSQQRLTPQHDFCPKKSKKSNRNVKELSFLILTLNHPVTVPALPLGE